MQKAFETLPRTLRFYALTAFNYGEGFSYKTLLQVWRTVSTYGSNLSYAAVTALPKPLIAAALIKEVEFSELST